MALACKPIHLADGYQLNSTDGYSFTSNWVNVIDYDVYCINVSLVGGTPVGTLSLQQSCDIPADAGPAQGTGGFNPQYPLGFVGPAIQVPRWADPYRGTQWASDLSIVPGGFGTVTANVNGAGTYTLNDRLFAYSFVRVVYTASSNVNTAISIYMAMKG